jgi:hypothetical protein
MGNAWRLLAIQTTNIVKEAQGDGRADFERVSEVLVPTNVVLSMYPASKLCPTEDFFS